MTTTSAAPGAATPPAGAPLLEVRDVRKHFPGRSAGLFGRRGNPVKAVDGVSFALHQGETLGLVGESGCGKSTTGRVIAKLIEPTSGSIRFQGKEIADLSTGQMRPLRREVQMIFQDPYSSLNPRHTIGTIVGSPFRIQGAHPEGGIKKAVQGLMERVGLNPEHYNRYPHEFSGGQRQRIGIARALALRPQLIVCDEPVSALDVSVQAQVVNLLEDLQNEFGLAYVFIAHDLSVVRHISDRVAVMYLGKIMEITDRDTLYEAPMHPYTHALLSAVPIPDPTVEARRERILLTGDLPSPSNPPSGCVFHTRCPKYRDQLSDGERERCRTEEPVLEDKRPGQSVYCHFAEVRSDIIDGEAPAPRSTGIREVIRKTAAGAPGTGIE
ncbi:dipeptide ABC transporter ATP-binding protein [Amnibacterium sp. CER49]|uniref:ABC transporter ATP-binding protein n=1 Tax=Amnibacterium sp. CER49 TaxID=3039161 RepID=UPI00244A1F9C|nr:dipeptide ABC transporter ATP-binding protein [Amnibacterium sp. CER49]MDH2445347.1 dipeptide ABC transporter ATP-binding protein [Amnibacterium sp. CER49]